MNPFVRFKDWWLGQYRQTSCLGKAALIVTPLFLCGLYLVIASVFVDLGGDQVPAAIANVTAEPAATATLATGAAPTATDERILSPVPATEPPTLLPTEATTRTAAPSPTKAPTRTTAPLPTIAPTRTAAPSSTPPPTSTQRPTATTAPTQTATLVPLPTATLAPLPTQPPPTATTSSASGGETAVVTNVVDGDTIDVNLNGSIVRVRYIGINTPESNEVCGSEATAANAALVANRTVTMVRDVSETDQYGRLLRYVYVGDLFVNGELVAGGWADAVEYPPDTRLAATLASLAGAGAGRGCDLVAAPLPTPPPDRGPGPIGNCDPSYPTVCIPPPPPDLDCGDITHRRFQVLPPDPHNFDGSDKDGVGCESG